jgi:hypothetical protein
MLPKNPRTCLLAFLSSRLSTELISVDRQKTHSQCPTTSFLRSICRDKTYIITSPSYDERASMVFYLVHFVTWKQIKTTLRPYFISLHFHDILMLFHSVQNVIFDIMSLFSCYLWDHKIICTEFDKCCLRATVKYMEQEIKMKRIVVVLTVGRLFFEWRVAWRANGPHDYRDLRQVRLNAVGWL